MTVKMEPNSITAAAVKMQQHQNAATHHQATSSPSPPQPAFPYPSSHAAAGHNDS